MKKILTLLAFLSCMVNLTANNRDRSGYIIKLNGDTIHGILQYQNSYYSGRKCLFKKSPDEAFTEYKPGEITGYRFNDDKFYITKEFKADSGSPAQIVFMEFLIDGIADIYYYNDVHGDHYFFQKSSDELIELPGKITANVKNHIVTPRYIGLLRSYLYDATDMEKEIDRTVLTHRSLINLARDYHAKVCSTENCIVFEKPNLGPIFTLDFILGTSLNRYNFGNLLFSSYEMGYQFGLGLKIENVFFSNERFNLKINLIAERDFKYTMTVSKDSYYNYLINYDNVDYTLNSHNAILTLPSLSVKMNVFDLKVPVIINYNYKIKSSSIYAGIGITDKWIISTNSKYKDVKFYEQYGRTFNKILVGGIGNIGYNKYLDNHHLVGINFSYEYLVDPKAANEFLRLVENQITFQINYSL